MNANQENRRRSEVDFDRLVDGELSRSQRRELLAALDNEPDGWRRCALAFLEAQAWKQDLGSMVHETPDLAEAAETASPAKPHRLGKYVGMVAAMAACFLLALYLGSWAQRQWHVPGPAVAPPSEVAVGPQAMPTPALEEPLRDTPQPDESQPNTPQQPDTPSSPWQVVTLAMPQGSSGETESIRLPAIERKTLDEKWLTSLPAAMPDAVLQALQRSGHQIQQHRQWLPLRMKDGRRLMVPVDEVEVHYVGGPPL